MEGNRFDELARGFAKNASRRSMVKGLGASALAVAAGLVGRRAEAKGAKVNICHRTGAGTFNYISVSENAVPAHLAHGDAVSDLTDIGNCGACGNACGAPENASATCNSGTCGFSCDDGYKLNEAGDACVTISLCPAGYEFVNGSCFQIVSGLNESLCTNACHVYGSVVDSGNYLCATQVNPLTHCSSSSDCPAGDACYHFSNSSNACIQAC